MKVILSFSFGKSCFEYSRVQAAFLALGGAACFCSSASAVAQLYSDWFWARQLSSCILLWRQLGSNIWFVFGHFCALPDQIRKLLDSGTSCHEKARSPGKCYSCERWYQARSFGCPRLTVIIEMSSNCWRIAVCVRHQIAFTWKMKGVASWASSKLLVAGWVNSSTISSEHMPGMTLQLRPQLTPLAISKGFLHGDEPAFYFSYLWSLEDQEPQCLSCW